MVKSSQTMVVVNYFVSYIVNMKNYTKKEKTPFTDDMLFADYMIVTSLLLCIKHIVKSIVTNRLFPL